MCVQVALKSVSSDNVVKSKSFIDRKDVQFSFTSTSSTSTLLQFRKNAVSDFLSLPTLFRPISLYTHQAEYVNLHCLSVRMLSCYPHCYYYIRTWTVQVCRKSNKNCLYPKKIVAILKHRKWKHVQWRSGSRKAIQCKRFNRNLNHLNRVVNLPQSVYNDKTTFNRMFVAPRWRKHQG